MDEKSVIRPRWIATPGRPVWVEQLRSGPDWSARVTWAFVGLGLFLRLFTYLLNYPLWWDEAFVAVNLLRRDYAGLIRPLDYGQVCPLLFLWGELTAVRVLGFSEWSLRLLPLLFSLASVIVFRALAVRLLDRRAGLLAVAIFAVSVHPIRHAADVKPYSLDLLVALCLQALAIRWWRSPTRAGRLLILCLAGPIALASSHPAIFVFGGITIALAWPVWSTRRSDVRIAYLASLAVSLIVYAVIYVSFTRSQASSASGGMREMWVRSFPPLDSMVGLTRWLAVVHGGDMMAYPCGGENGASFLSLTACLLGAISLWRSGRSTVLAILLMPMALALVAAGLRLYPYGGPAPHGSAARIMQYAAPGFCLLIGLGAARCLEAIGSWIGVDRSLRLASLGLLVVGFVPILEGLRHPYRAYQAEASRNFARRFWPEVGQRAEVACLRWDLDVAEWDSIHLGIAVFLCNQAIYLPSRSEGGPSWDAVSRDHPLRCVLGIAPESPNPRLLTWLEAMSKSYELTSRRSIPVETAEPGRASRSERYDVFEFRPKVGSNAGDGPIHPPAHGSSITELLLGRGGIEDGSGLLWSGNAIPFPR